MNTGADISALYREFTDALTEVLACAADGVFCIATRIAQFCTRSATANRAADATSHARTKRLGVDAGGAKPMAVRWSSYSVRV